MNPQTTSPDGASTFDPVDWLARAERCGYRVYLGHETGNGRFTLVMERPCGAKTAEELGLWNAFQGRDMERRNNRFALVAHLARIGQFAPRSSDDPRSAPRPQPRLTRVVRQSVSLRAEAAKKDRSAS